MQNSVHEIDELVFANYRLMKKRGVKLGQL